MPDQSHNDGRMAYDSFRETTEPDNPLSMRPLYPKDAGKNF